MEPADPHRPLVLPRRRFLAGGTALGAGLALGASGCALNNPFSSKPTPAGPGHGLAADIRIAEQASVAIGDARAVVDRAAGHLLLAGRLAPLLAMHDAHRAALADAVPTHARIAGPTTPTTSGAPSSPPASLSGTGTPLTRVRTAERALHDSLTAFALLAESGLFARLLGSMAASVSQHLAELSR